eukprot:gb/GECG01000039.1/.p1 GENE.gb/GECG01000039.1/~~gb/GECG01000039.1/.p1  ORF type:complete len:218 (+),score=36.44 gb/GECG01000039.1/:1-654(+)
MALDPHWYDYIDGGEESSADNSSSYEEDDELFRKFKAHHTHKHSVPTGDARGHSSPVHSQVDNAPNGKAMNPPGKRKTEMTLKADWQGAVEFPQEVAKKVGGGNWRCGEVVLDTRYWHHLRFRNYFCSELCILQDEYGSWKMLTPDPVQLMPEGTKSEAGANTVFDLRIGGPIEANLSRECFSRIRVATRVDEPCQDIATLYDVAFTTECDNPWPQS